MNFRLKIFRILIIHLQLVLYTIIQLKIQLSIIMTLKYECHFQRSYISSFFDIIIT